jgi:O-acetyl-ADP-ribose deacetylase (regulator of RNase III)
MMSETRFSIDYGDGKLFQVVVGDLLKEDTHCIVNAANGHLAHGGGVAGAIARAGGRSLIEEGDRLVRESGPVPTGGCVVTTAGDLPFKGVIHAVGPRMGEGDEENKLMSALKCSFLSAQDRGWGSVSFPAVGSGIFGVPYAVCTRAYRKAIDDFWKGSPDSCLKLIRLVLHEGPMLDEVQARLADGR